ncbi:MAG: hypothetical protein AB7O65_04740 [Candidatus Korobacteraceae bacterium]
MRADASNPRSLLSALAIVVLAGVVTVGHVAGAVHSIAVQHIQCVQHGGLEEVQWNASPGSQGSLLLRAAEPGSEHRHQHCSLLSNRGADRIVRPITAQSLLPAAPPLRQSRPEVKERQPDIVVYLSAPKHSPPLA